MFMLVIFAMKIMDSMEIQPIVVYSMHDARTGTMHVHESWGTGDFAPGVSS